MTAFAVVLTRKLKKRGLHGDPAQVTLGPDAIFLVGAKAGLASIPYAAILRLRVGYTEGESMKYFESSLFLVGGERLVLHHRRHHGEGYRDGIMALAVKVAAIRGIGAVERGVSMLSAFSGPILLGIPAMGAIAVSIFALTDEPIWARLLVPLFPIAALAFLIWQMPRHFPRSVASLDELAIQLPPRVMQ